MAITVTQEIYKVSRNPDTGYIKKVFYRTTAVDGEHSLVREGFTDLPEEPETLPDNFVAFNSATEEQVKAWVLTQWPEGVDVFANEQETVRWILQKKLNLITASGETTPPWA